MRVDPQGSRTPDDVARAASAQFEQLIGQPLWRCTNAGDLVAFQFGAVKPVDGYAGPGEVGEVALHVQCQWRIVRSGQPLTSRPDLFVAAGSGEENLSPDEFDCYRDRTQFLDAIEQLFGAGERQFLVQRVRLGGAGDLDIEIGCEGGLTLQVWPGTTLEYESWRIVKPYTEAPHWVCRGLRIYKE